MYLAKLGNGDRFNYQLRISHKTNARKFTYQIIYDFGPDPRQHFDIFEGHIILYNNNLLQAVSSQAKGDAELLLENLLWQFFPEETRRRLERFHGRSTTVVSRLSPEEKTAIESQIHIFDRRRLYYLRYGAVDQSRLSRLHDKCCRPLIDKSRDEKEYYFRAEEMSLEPGMFFQYVYAIFNLQKYFSQSFAPWLPESLAKEELEDKLITEICRLNGDAVFWAGEDHNKFLHAHLHRYLIMFFDHSPAPRSFFAEFSRRFMADHRKFRWPQKSPSASPEEIAEVFDTSYSELSTMSKEQLSKLFRQKAMRLHPDKGGDHEQFIILADTYQTLLSKKN